ncbi:MAG: hypothetical protein ACI90V_006237, partial [Bacillariaceae sp.]|jgi:hypothetical protein
MMTQKSNSPSILLKSYLRYEQKKEADQNYNVGLGNLECRLLEYYSDIDAPSILNPASTRLLLLILFELPY